LVSKLREKPKNLREEMQRIYGYIANETFDFDQGIFSPAYFTMLTFPVDLDVPVIEALTKADIMDFFNTYLSPASLRRAKLSVHMVAQKTAVPETLSDADKRDKLCAALLQVFAANKLVVDEEKLKASLHIVDFSQDAPPPVLDAAEAVDLLGMSVKGAEEASVEATRAAFTAATPAIAKVWGEAYAALKEKPKADIAEVKSALEPLWIEDGHAFRSKLEATSSVQPVRDISDFEDTEPKL
jgi:insulysin